MGFLRSHRESEAHRYLNTRIIKEIHVGERLLSSRRRTFYLPPENRSLGMMFQAFAVWPHLSVYENVAFPLRVRKLSPTKIDFVAEDGVRGVVKRCAYLGEVIDYRIDVRGRKYACRRTGVPPARARERSAASCF